MQEELWKTSCLELHCSNGRQPITVIVRLLLFNKITPLYIECSSAEEKARHQYPPCTFPICLHNYSMVLKIFPYFISMYHPHPLGCITTWKTTVYKVRLKELVFIEQSFSFCFCNCSMTLILYSFYRLGKWSQSIKVISQGSHG